MQIVVIMLSSAARLSEYEERAAVSRGFFVLDEEARKCLTRLRHPPPPPPHKGTVLRIKKNNPRMYSILNPRGLVFENLYFCFCSVLLTATTARKKHIKKRLCI